MYKKDNIYTRREETLDGKTRYYITFTDAHGNTNEHEVGLRTYEVVRESQRNEERIARKDKRYLEHLPLTQDEIDGRTASRELPMDDLLRLMAIEDAIESLPQPMKKRLISHYIEGFSSEEIARMEGVKSQAVSLSIRRAIKAIRKKIKKV